MIPYMHTDLAAEHIADIHAQASRDRAARIARQARRLRRRSAERAPVSSLPARPSVLAGHAAGDESQPGVSRATERREVA